MNKEHYNELIMVSQEIHDLTNDKLKAYFENAYATADEGSMSQQLEDWLFIAEESSAFLLGNVIALLDADSQEAEIKSFVDDLRRVMAYAAKKLGSDQKPN